jgi:hypothetical protein
MSSRQFSPRASRIVGGLIGGACVAYGLFPILLGTGVWHPSNGPGTPWLLIAAGVAFEAIGLLVVISFGVLGGPTATEPQPAWRVVQYCLTAAFVAPLALLFGWAAVQPRGLDRLVFGVLAVVSSVATIALLKTAWQTWRQASSRSSSSG